MPIDNERQTKAKEYARIRHRLFALDLILSAAALLIVLLSGLSVWLRNIVVGISADPWISTALYFIAGVIAYGLVFMPLSYYSGFVLPHRYGLATQKLGGWLIDQAKGGALGLVFGALMIEVIYFLLRTTAFWWLWAAVFMLLFSVVLANLAPVLIFPLFYKFKPLEDAELVQRLLRLAERAHTRVRGVYTMMLSEKTTAANAAFMGLGNTKRIVLGDTLYQNYTHDEIETILAHELGHQVHNDIVYGIAIETGLTIIGLFIADLILHVGIGVIPGLQSVYDLAAMPLLGLALGAYGLITMPLSNAYSRWREAGADRYALETTRNVSAFIGAMEKLANQNLSELEPEPWVEFLLYDHPTIGKRLEMGRAFQESTNAPSSL